MSKYFWTNAVQATERLMNSIILYDGSPCLVRAIENDDVEGDVFANVRISLPEEEGGKYIDKRISLADPKFDQFRKLPALGWFNHYDKATAMYISRAIIGTRTHGLNGRNTNTLYFYNTKGFGLLDRPDGNIVDYYKDDGFADACKNLFPPLEEILRMQPKNSATAYSPKYCVMRSTTGLRLLYRNKEVIGLFTGTDSFYLFEDKGFYREELQEDPLFTINNIQEF